MYFATVANGKETGTWTQTAVGPSARFRHAMSSLGNGKVLMYGGSESNREYLNDVWMHHGGDEEVNLATWSRLENAMFKRSDHAMAPIILSDTENTKKIKQIVMFGGTIDPITSPLHDSKIVWTMSTGCPPGSQWKSTTTNETTGCTSCPSQTTTSIRAATAKNQCNLCVNRNGIVSNGTCTCNIFFRLGDNCKFPTSGILITMIIGAIPFGFFIIRQSWKKHFNTTVEDMEYDYEVMEDQLNTDVDQLNTNLKKEQDDKLKMQKAWIVKYDDIQLDQVIGKGAFGEVKRGRWRGLDVAVKKMFPEEMEKFGYDKMDTSPSTTIDNALGLEELALTMLSNLEIGVMMRLRHPRIVTFLGAGEIVDPPLEGDNVPRVGIFVMLEYAAGGDLIHQ
jgi:hypothetical protein